MSGAGSEVKNGPRRSRGRGLLRHLEGWQLAVVIVGAALLGAILAVPRPVEPDVMPLPRVDWKEVKRESDRELELAHRAEQSPLPYEVRAVGEVFRAFGTSNSGDAPTALAAEVDHLPALARAAHEKYGDQPLLELEATQTELFLQALARFEDGEDTSREIAELGGNFLDKAKASKWLTAKRSFAMRPHERRALFRVRWAELTGLRALPAFAPSANEWRIYYGFLLENPEESGNSPSAVEQGLKIVAAVEKLDPEYPGLFARGVLYYRLGNFAKSAQAFRGHLLRYPSGAWRLRAQNHLAAASLRAKENDE